MKDKIEATTGFLTENVLSIIAEYGKETAKEQVKQVVTEEGVKLAAMIGVDMAGSMIPGIGNAISSYRTQKQIKNLSVFIAELEKRMKEIQSNLKEQTEENKQTLDSVLEIVMEKAANTSQSGKIEYMINGFTNLTNTENISYDISYLYYDVLERMTMLDISALRLSYVPLMYMEDERKTYLDIMEEFNIDYYQYISVRENLNRMGLLENVYDDALEKDLNSMISNVNDLNKSVSSIQEALEDPRKMKRIIKLKKNTNIKLKAKDSLKTSKFGRAFTEFFIESNCSL